MGLFSSIGKHVQDSIAAPWTAAQDVLVRGDSPAAALEKRWDHTVGGVKEIGGELFDSIGIDNPFGGGGGGGGGGGSGGGIAGRGGYVPGTMYVDPSKIGGFSGGLTGRGGDIAGLYGQAAGDFYGGFGLDPGGELSAAYTYDPNLIETDQLRRAQAFDFDPMREQALGQLAGQSRSGLETALTGQAAAGGLTAADRMALASSFNRQRMGAEADVLGKFGVAEARNLWETEKANQDMLNQAYLANLQAGNEAQLQNIRTLIEQSEKRGAIAQEMFEADKRIKAGEALAGGGLPGFDPYAQGPGTKDGTPLRREGNVITNIPKSTPKPTPKPARSTSRRGKRSTSDKIGRRLQALEA